LEGCDIFGHSQAGVEVRDGAEATLRRCKLRHNQGPGLRVHADGKAAAEECDLSENVLANLEVRHGGNPTLPRCKLRQGKQAGALFGRDAQGTPATIDDDGQQSGLELHHVPCVDDCRFRWYRQS